MKFIEITLVGLMVSGALLYLYRLFFLKKNDKNCGCGTSGCKVPKPLVIQKNQKSPGNSSRNLAGKDQA